MAATYESIVITFEKIFASSWGETLQVYPLNFVPTTRPSEFGVLEVLPFDSSLQGFSAEGRIKGQLILQIYWPVGVGPRRPYLVADALDSVLRAKVLDNNIQTGVSALVLKGNDEGDPSLSRADYVLSFTSY